MIRNFVQIHRSDGPIIAAAIHNGHELRSDIADLIQLSSMEREREEDPHTSGWTVIGDARIIVNRSRFEVDVNRSRNRAVYIEPEDAWGLLLYREKPARALISESLAEYDHFYKEANTVLRKIKDSYDHFVLLDIHSYNHRRDGINAPHADPETHPEVNIGTGTIRSPIWRSLVERFISELREFDFLGRNLDVRENIIFRGGYFPRWINRKYSQTGCAIAIEFKKFWMDEWTGEIFPREYDAILECLKSTITDTHLRIVDMVRT